MRLLVTVAIVTLNVAIISNAAPNRTVDYASVNSAIPSSSSDQNPSVKKRKGSFNIPDEISQASTKGKEEMANATSDAQKREALELVMDRARKFSSQFLTIWQNLQDTFVVSPLMQFLYVATFPYGTQEGMKRAVMDGLGFGNDDPRTVELGLRILIDDVKNFMTIEPSERHRQTDFTCQQNHKLFDRVQTSLFKFMRSSFDAHPMRECGRWDIKFDVSQYVEPEPSDGRKKTSTEMKYMCINLRCRYGNYKGSTFVELISNKNHSENGTSLFIIRSDDKQGAAWLKKNLGAMNFDKLRANSEERVVELYLPKFAIKRDCELRFWAPRFFRSENPFAHIEYYTRGIASPPDFKLSDFDRKYSVRIGRNRGGRTPAKSDAIINEDETAGSSESEESVEFVVNRPFAIIMAKTGEINLNLVTIFMDHGIF